MRHRNIATTVMYDYAGAEDYRESVDGLRL
jgi:hypothetical protein